MAPRETRIAARNSQACEACRHQKARCRPSCVPNTCEKCLQADNECIPHVPKTRSRRRYSRRSLARIEQRIEELCQRIDLQPIAEASSLIPDQQTSDQAPAALNDVQSDTTNVPSAPLTQEPGNHTVQQARSSKSRSATSEDTHLLPPPERAPLEPPKWALYGQSLLPSFSPAALIGQSPGQTLLDRLETPTEPKAEVRLLARYFPQPCLMGTVLVLIKYLDDELTFHLQKIAALLALDIDELGQLLATFRSMAFHFPIVFPPEEASVTDCILRKPFVILAMLVASSSANERLQVACDHTFRNVLARDVIVEGKKNLELLQGLLIYLAWHHHYLRHETQQIYQYLQLAIGMVVDLGLHKPKSKQRTPQGLSHSGLKSGRTSAEGATAEEDRALLGCYSLSCGLAVLGFDKPQNLAYTDHLRRCGQNLAENGPYETDRDWLPTVDLLHIAEEIQRSSRTDAEAKTPSGMPEAPVRDAEQQLQQWKYRSLNGTRDHVRLSLTFHFVQIYLYEKALSEQRSIRSQHVQIAGNTSGAPMLLLSTLHASQAFLDDILLKPASLLRNMNIVEWTHLITAAITLAKLARLGPDQTRETGIEHSQIKTQVEMYTLCLCKRMSDVGLGSVQPDVSGLFSWFKAIAQGIRLWVSGPEESSGPEHAEQENTAHPPNSHAASAFETGKNWTLQTESNQQWNDTQKPHTTDRSYTGNVPAMRSDRCEMVQDDNFWDTFISNWPDITMPSAVWKG